MIYSVIPEELAPELYERLVEYYKDDPNVKVIIDRRKSERRGPTHTGAGRAAHPPRPAPDARRRASSRRSTPTTSEAPAPVKVVVHVDGGARGNPGSGRGGRGASRRPTATSSTRPTELLGVATNNVAEYRGLLLGLERARALGADEVEVVNDSELVAKQVNGEYKVKHPDMKPLHAQARTRARRVRRAGACAACPARRTPPPTRSSTRPSTTPRMNATVSVPAPADNRIMSPVPLSAAPVTPGLTPPSSRGRSSRQIGDIVVGLGYAGRESVELAITEAKAPGGARARSSSTAAS